MLGVGADLNLANFEKISRVEQSLNPKSVLQRFYILIATIDKNVVLPRFKIFRLFRKHNKNSIVFGALEGIRTPNLLIRSQAIYPVDLRAQLIAKLIT
jgi:hypothetical protein